MYICEILKSHIQLRSYNYVSNDSLNCPRCHYTMAIFVFTKYPWFIVNIKNNTEPKNPWLPQRATIMYNVNDSSKNFNSTSNCIVSSLTGTPIWSLMAFGSPVTAHYLCFQHRFYQHPLSSNTFPYIQLTSLDLSYIRLQFYQCIISSRKVIQQSRFFCNRVCTS